MRSIGKKRIAKLNTVIDEFWKNRDKSAPFYLLEEQIIDALPADWWDTWEMADQEIRRIVYDTLSEKIYA